MERVHVLEPDLCQRYVSLDKQPNFSGPWFALPLHGGVNASFVRSWRSERKEPAMVPEREKAFDK